MTTLIEDLQALLNPLVAGGSHYQINQLEAPTYPFIVFQRISSTPNVSLTGPSDFQNTRIQVDIFALRVSDTTAIENAVNAAFAASAISNVPLSSQDFYEDPVKAFRISLDFSIWSTN